MCLDSPLYKMTDHSIKPSLLLNDRDLPIETDFACGLNFKSQFSDEVVYRDSKKRDNNVSFLPQKLFTKILGFVLNSEDNSFRFGLKFKISPYKSSSPLIVNNSRGYYH